jgi:type III pantothenate kinase
VHTSAETLFRRTARLSATELVPPRSVIGRRTDEAIRSGVVLGTAELVDGIIRRLKSEWPGDQSPYVVATGGLAASFSPICSSIGQVVPELTLVGLRMAWEGVGPSPFS